MYMWIPIYMDIIQNKYYILSLSLSIVIGSLEPKTRHVAYQLPHLVLLCHTQPTTVARALVQSAKKYQPSAHLLPPLHFKSSLSLLLSLLTPAYRCTWSGRRSPICFYTCSKSGKKREINPSPDLRPISSPHVKSETTEALQTQAPKSDSHHLCFSIDIDLRGRPSCCSLPCCLVLNAMFLWFVLLFLCLKC